MLWFDTTDLMHYPPFVDKTLKLFNLKQVAHEIETSVMSKVSCTACKAGKTTTKKSFFLLFIIKPKTSINVCVNFFDLFRFRKKKKNNFFFFENK